VKTLFPRSRKHDEDEAPQHAPAVSQRPLPQHEQRLMFEASVHWGRGLAILLGMAAIVVAFLVILTVLPKPGDGNPIDSLTGLSNTLSGTNSTPVAGGVAATSAALQTVAARPAPGPSSTGTPTPKWVGVARQGAPNVRSAPSTNNNPIGNLAPGRQVEVIGKSADNAWLQIVWDNNQKAWVAQDLMAITTGDPTQIPVVRNP
jgi:hypothetical protein